MTIPSAHPDMPRRGRRRRLALALCLALPVAAMLLATGLAWLTQTASGFAGLCRIAERLGDGRLRLVGPHGTFGSAWRVDSLRWRDAGIDLAIDDLGVDWRLGSLLRGRLEIDRLNAARLRIAMPQSAGPLTLPRHLRAPLEVSIGRLALGRLYVAEHVQPDSPGLMVAENISAGIDSSHERHVVRSLRATLSRVRLEGELELTSAAPFELTAGARATGEADGHRFALDLAARGTLARVEVAGDARGDQVSGSVRAEVTPFEAQPFTRTRIDLHGINPAHWLDGAPQADLTLKARLAPLPGPAMAIAGDFELTNARAGRLDEERLPLAGLRGALRWRAAELGLDDLVADLAGGGRLGGSGKYAGGRLELDLTAEAVDAATLHGRLKPTRLSGPLKSSLSLLRQSVDARLNDPRFSLAARLELRQRNLAVDDLQLASGAARLSARGHLLLNDSAAFDLAGKLTNFDPSRFVKSPAGRLNAAIEAAGVLRPQPALKLRFRLDDSQFNGQSLAGAGTLQLENRRLHAVDLNLAAGRNTLSAVGAFGMPADTLALNIDAPALDGFGIEGGLSARIDLGGSLESPRFDGRVRSDKLVIPGWFGLHDLRFEGRLGSAATSPLTATLHVARLDLPGRPALASAVRIDLAGSRARHRLGAVARLQDKFTLDLAAEGGLTETATSVSGWAGRITGLGAAGAGGSPLVRLTAPATLMVDSARVALGRAEFSGALWSARLLQLEHDGRQWRSRGDIKAFPVGLLALPRSTLTVNGEWDFELGSQLQGRARLWREQGDVIFGGTLPFGLDLTDASIELAAADRRLKANWKLAGRRIGAAAGRLDAAMGAPGTLDRQAPWQGELRLDTPDVAWAAILLGEGIELGGKVEGRMTVSGSPERPALHGTLTGSGLSVQLRDQDLRLERGSLLAEVDGETLYLRQLTFDSPLQAPPRALQLAGGAALLQLARQPGRLTASGEIRPWQERGQIDLRIDRLGLMQRPDQWIALSGEGTLRLGAGTLAVTGKTRLDAGWWELAKAGAPRLSDDVIIRRSGATVTPARPMLLKATLDIDADLGQDFHFRGAGVESRLAGSVRVRAESNQPVRATGSVRTVDGRFDAYGQKLAIERGIVNFQGLLDNPGLNFRALRKNQAVEAGVEVGGTAQRPLIRLVSVPDVPDPEKLSWLVQGRGLEEGGGADSARLLAAAGTILGGQEGGAFRQLRSAFGVDEFGIRRGSLDGSPASMPTSRVASARGFDASGQTAGAEIVSLGKRLSSDAILSFEQSMGSTESVVKLTVNLGRGLSVIGRAGTTSAIDLFYSYSFGD